MNERPKILKNLPEITGLGTVLALSLSLSLSLSHIYLYSSFQQIHFLRNRLDYPIGGRAGLLINY